MDKAYTLHSVLLDYAPDAQAQTFCSAVYNAMKSEPSMSDRDIEGQLVGALHDGLNHGNWPWTQQFYLKDPQAATAEYHARCAANKPELFDRVATSWTDLPEGLPEGVQELDITLDGPDEVAHTWPGICRNCGRTHDGPDADQLRPAQPDASSFYVCRVCGKEKPVDDLTGCREDDQWYWACRSHS